jgi:large subunit ribosomal protein L9
MKVILLENLKKIGSIGEIIEVKRGFGRNFLISNKKALYASKENISQVEKIKSDLSKKDNEKKKKQNKFQIKFIKKSTRLKNLVQKTRNYMDLLNLLKYQN